MGFSILVFEQVVLYGLVFRYICFIKILRSVQFSSRLTSHAMLFIAAVVEARFEKYEKRRVIIRNARLIIIL